MPPISGASCRHAGTAPERSNAREGWTPSEGRNPLAQGDNASRVRIRDAGQVAPEAPRPSIPRYVSEKRLPIPWPSARDERQSGPLCLGIAAELRRELTRPHRGSTRASRSFRSDPPGFGPVDRGRATHLSKISTRASRRLPAFGENRGRRVLRFTSLHPLRPAGSLAAPAFSSGVARARQASGAPGIPGRPTLRQRPSPEAPRRVARAHRVTGG